MLRTPLSKIENFRGLGYQWIYISDSGRSENKPVVIAQSWETTPSIAPHPEGQTDSSTVEELQVRLERKGAGIRPPLTPELLFATGDQPAIGTATLQWDILGCDGVPLQNVVVNMLPSDDQILPPAIVTAHATHELPARAKNKAKVLLKDWSPPVFNQDSVMEFTFARSDYHTAPSFREAAADLQKDLINGYTTLEELPMPIGISVVAVTEDNQLLLSKRRQHLHQNKGRWEISASEWIDPDQDCRDGRLQIHRTIYRAIEKSDELHLSRPFPAEPEIRLFAIVLNWELMDLTIFALVHLRGMSNAEVSARRTVGGEFERFASEPFTIERCLPLLLNEEYSPRGRPQFRGLLCDIHRVGLLGALYSKFGKSEVQRYI